MRSNTPLIVYVRDTLLRCIFRSVQPIATFSLGIGAWQDVTPFPFRRNRSSLLTIRNANICTQDATT